MKKITFMVLGMAAMVAVACGEKKETAKEGEATTTEAPAETPAGTPAETPVATGDAAVLDNYIALVDKLVEAQASNNTAELTKLTQEFQAMAPELAKIDPSKFTPEQAEKFAAVGKKYAEAMMAK
ncbi:MAG: DUF6591 domain-containing protein [Flavobacterium sp.]